MIHAVAVEQADQQLRAVHDAVREVEDRLLVEHEAVALERLAQPLDPAQRARARRAAAAVAPGDREAVAAALLGLVAGDLGLGELLGGRQLGRRARSRGCPSRASRGPCGRRARSWTCSRAASTSAWADRLGVLERGLRQDHAELVAAEPADDVGVAQPRAQQRRHRAEQLVAGRVAVAVVDVVEVVDVERQQRGGVPVALGVADDPLELLAEAPAVVEARSARRGRRAAAAGPRSACDRRRRRTCSDEVAALAGRRPARRAPRRARRGPRGARSGTRSSIGRSAPLRSDLQARAAGPGAPRRSRALLEPAPAQPSLGWPVISHSAVVGLADRDVVARDQRHPDRRVLERGLEARLGGLQRGLGPALEVTSRETPDGADDRARSGRGSARACCAIVISVPSRRRRVVSRRTTSPRHHAGGSARPRRRCVGTSSAATWPSASRSL